MKNILIYLCFLFPFVLGSADAEVLIITNKNVVETTLSVADIKEIFLGKKVLWSDNTSINLVTLGDENIHKEFLKTYISKTKSQFRIYWQKMFFTGMGLVPKKMGSVEEMVNFVSSTGGAIGYIDIGSVTDAVNSIKIR